MTRVTLIHNPDAGAGGPDRDELLGLLAEAGYEVRYRSTRDEDYKKALKEPGELVIVAGGDGTVRKVAKRLVGSGVPLAVLPLGTANNVATSLGIAGGGREWVEGLGAARRAKFDVGRARGPWGTKRFFEAAGLGLFTAVMVALDVRKEQDPAFERAGEPLAVAIRALQEALADYPAQDLRLSLDGEDLSGRYLLVEAMNIRHVGPNLLLAPDADPGDGLLDIVLLPEDRRGEFTEYLRYRLEGKQEAPSLIVRRGRCLEFGWDGTALRFDDKAWPKKEKKRREMLQRAGERARRGGLEAVEISLEDEGIEFLIPRRRKGRVV